MDKIVKDLRDNQNNELILRGKQLEYAKAGNPKAYFEINLEIKKAELLQAALEKEANDLKNDAFKYYNGNLPKALDNEWRKREKIMLDDKLAYSIKSVIISADLYDFLKREGLLK